MNTSLKPNAFTEALKATVGENKVGWSTNDHLRFLDSLISALVDQEGNPVVLTAEQKALLQLAIAPTPELQRLAIRRAFRDPALELDEDSMKTIENVAGVTAFSDFLATATNPETGQKYIAKVEKSGRKKALAALVGQASASGGTA